MSELPAHPPEHTQRIEAQDNRPKIGEFYWVTENTWEKVTESCNGEPTNGEGPTTEEHLMCAYHLASNHVEFVKSGLGGSQEILKVRYRDLAALTRRELGWQDVLRKRIEETQAELKRAVERMIDVVRSADLMPSDPCAPQNNMLPATTRESPEATKQALIKAKEKDFPEAKKEVEKLTKEMVAAHSDHYLPFKAEVDRMSKAIKGVDNRLFALQLYAGIGEHVQCLREGKAPPSETPVTVRQMIRYMDEEILIDLDDGGMDYQKIGDFNAWVIKDENLHRLCPEPRCIVALQVRRNPKEYNNPANILGFFQQLESFACNMWTYLLIRNGEQVYCLFNEIEFRPRLLPYRNEFTEQFQEIRRGWYGEADKIRHITPDDLDYDKHVEDRLLKIYKYNRVMFLVQGLLDRSKVFAPHPPINLANPDHIEAYFHMVFDEEDGLPSANPPVWEVYRDSKNAQIAKGSHVYSTWYDDKNDYEYDRFLKREVLKKGRDRPRICEVESISKNKQFVMVTWPWGTRCGYEHKDSRGRGYHGKWGEWPVDKVRHARIPIKKVFNVSAYVSGEFKTFLCDAYLKGAYLEWAPALFAAERWLNPKEEKK